MKKIESEQIKISVSGSLNKVNGNKVIRITYLVMALIYILHIVFFGLSASFIPTFYGGLMSTFFIAGYCVAAYLIIKKNEDSTFISLLYLVLIYAIPCCWMGIGYVLTNNAQLLDYLQSIICFVSMVLAILGIVYYYKNNYKFSSIFAFSSMIISIIGLSLGGISEIMRVINMVVYQGYNVYIPLVGSMFIIEAAVGIVPLIYLFKTV